MQRSFFSMCLAVLLLAGCGDSRSAGDAEARRGYEAYNRTDYQAAIDHFQQAVELGVTQHTPAELHTSIGNCYNELDQLDESIWWHKMALEEDPTLHNAWVNLGVVHRLQGNFDEAESCYQKALDIDPNYPELHASLGALYIFREQPEKAVESLEKSIALDGNIAIAHSNLALAYAMVGRFDDADRELKRAVALGYENGSIIGERIDNLRELESDQ